MKGSIITKAVFLFLLMSSTVFAYQNEITQPMPLLNDEGHITEEGWARYPYWEYDRDALDCGWLDIKEWDYYAVISHDKGYGIAVTVSDLEYLALISITWYDFNAGTFTQFDEMKFFTNGKIGLAESQIDNDISFEGKDITIELIAEEGNRSIYISAPDFETDQGDKGLSGLINLYQNPQDESMTIATSWEEDREKFYYNTKVNNMTASGAVTIGETTYTFSPETDFACLDWGERGRLKTKFWTAFSVIAYL
jgi:hypothetical protein